MTTVTHATLRPIHPLPEGVLLNDVRDAFERLRQAQKAWVTRRALRKLNDRELADVGLSRTEIDDIASRASMG